MCGYVHVNYTYNGYEVTVFAADTQFLSRDPRGPAILVVWSIIREGMIRIEVVNLGQPLSHSSCGSDAGNLLEGCVDVRRTVRTNICRYILPPGPPLPVRASGRAFQGHFSGRCWPLRKVRRRAYCMGSI